jgi:hypothetical protein
MTVCAGFLCTDGLIIGADTEFSGGLKYHAQKLRREPFASGEYVVTGTGNSSFLGMANDVIKAALGKRRKQFEQAVSTEERVWIFQDAIHKIIGELHREHMQFPAYDDQPIYLELLIGVHFKGEDEQVKLMHCAGDGGVTWMGHHFAIGMGADIALRFLTILSPDPRPVDVMTAIAFLCIAEAKLSAEGVGGDSELMRLPHPSGPILQTWYSESPLLEIAEEALHLAVCAPREKLTNEAFEAKLKAFSDKLRKVKSAVDRAPESERITLELIRMARSERDNNRPTP